ncbi:MAG: bifunctional hydroxymethylpyrimidine kinase/phosphomethylpyrimidine kinase, partial [Acidobacteria bacterium]|nr:bifunctional hydroxymethylpyrimidine kinase/phosphomethylpyrimidine kinase [Acidobacteriota bacterium]
MPTGEQTPKIVMVVAGFDPSGGAGITADIKTVAAHGLYGTSAITALTVQTTQGVSRWEPVSPETVQATLEALIEDSPPAAVKIGMLGSGKAARCVAEVLRAGRLRNVILDPVIRSTLGAELIDSEGLDILRSELV